MRAAFIPPRVFPRFNASFEEVSSIVWFRHFTCGVNSSTDTKLIQDEPVMRGDATCLPVANVVQPGRPLQHCRNSGTAMWRRKKMHQQNRSGKSGTYPMTKSTQSVNEEFDSPGDMRFLKYQFPSPSRKVYAHRLIIK